MLGGQLRLHASSDELAEAAVRIAQGMVRVSDVWFTFRSRALQTTADEARMVPALPASYELAPVGERALRTTADEVDDWLRRRTITFERAVKEMGRSTREWTIDFRTTTVDRTTFVFLLSAESRRDTSSVTNRVVTGCVDLNHLKERHNNLALVSLFDDTEDIWGERRFRLTGECFRNCPLV